MQADVCDFNQSNDAPRRVQLQMNDIEPRSFEKVTAYYANVTCDVNGDK